MAPKRAASSGPAKKAPRKAAKQAEVDASPAAETEDAGSQPGTPASGSSIAVVDKQHWGQVSKMLSYLKYHSKDSNKDQDDMQDAKTALLKYNSLTGVDKQMFLHEYQKNKKNLKWTRTFKTSSAEVDTIKTGATEVWYNVFQILTANGLDPHHLDAEERTSVTTDLLKDNAARFDYEISKQDCHCLW